MATLIRVYRYTDPNMGWGDAGTIMVRASPEELHSNQEAAEWIRSKGHPYSMDEGVEIITPEGFHKLVASAKESLKEAQEELDILLGA